MRDEKEKADIAATVRVFVSYWEKHHPGEMLPPEVSGAQPSASPLANLHTSTINLGELLRKSMAAALDQVPVRFTTKEFFPLVPEIQAEEVPESQGYDFLRRLVDEGKLWISQQAAGRRPTTYSKEPVEVSGSRTNGTNSEVVTTSIPLVHGIGPKRPLTFTGGGQAHRRREPEGY